MDADIAIIGSGVGGGAVALQLADSGARLAILERGERSARGRACICCGTCDAFPCRLGAKGDAEICLIDPALQRPNVTLHPFAA